LLEDKTKEELLEELKATRQRVAELEKIEIVQFYLASIVESSEDAIIGKTLEGIITTWNKSAERIFGYCAEEVIGRPVSILIPSVQSNEGPQILEKIKRGERIDHYETRRVRKDGLHIDVSLTISPIKSGSGKILGASMFAREISERKQNEKRLSMQYTLTRILAEFATLSDAVPLILQVICEGIGWDLGVLWIYDRTDGQLHCLELWHMPLVTVPEFEAITRSFAFKPGFGLPGRVLLSGIPLWIPDVTADDSFTRSPVASLENLHAAFCFPIRFGSEVLGAIEFFSQDRRESDEVLLHSMATVGAQIGQFIERERAQKARAQLLAREQEARKQAEEASRLKDEFLATISHELRTPLTSMLGWVQMLRSGKLDPSMAVRALETIERNVKSQAQLIEDLLDISRITTGRLRLEIRPLDPASVINAAVDAVRPAADAKNIRIQTIFDSDAGPISGDYERLQQVVWNLLSNSIKFTPKGGRVQIQLERVNSHVEINVSDTGQGIKIEFLPYIFDRFTQADSSNTRSFGGIGMGLAIVKSIIEMHGGTVAALSKGEGHGSTFTVKLPLMAIRQEDVELEQASGYISGDSSLECPPVLEGLKILVVDDEIDTCEMLKAMFEHCGAQVEIANSAAKAIESIDRHVPDILVSDIGMPGDTGYELIRQIREREPKQGGKIPAVALTAFARVEDRMKVLSAGFQMHVPKPVEPAELITIVASLSGLVNRTDN
jgi:PAS domain S-box-containing protein